MPGQMMKVRNRRKPCRAGFSSLISHNTHGETEDQREKGTCSLSHYKSVQAAFLSAFGLGSWPGLPFTLNAFASAHPSPSLGILCLSPLSVYCHLMAPHNLLFLPLPSNSLTPYSASHPNSASFATTRPPLCNISFPFLLEDSIRTIKIIEVFLFHSSGQNISAFMGLVWETTVSMGAKFKIPLDHTS